MGNEVESPVTALWEPDVTPPVDWLAPAILYQDRISTFAPLAGAAGEDNDDAIRLGQLLGSRYVPFGMGNFWQLEHVEEAAAVLCARLPAWQRSVEELAGRTGDDSLRSWLDRVRGWNAKERKRHDALRHAQLRYPRARAAESAARQRVADASQRRNQLLARLNQGRGDVLQRPRCERLAPYGSLPDEHKQLVRQLRANSDDPELNQRVLQIQEKMRAIASDLPPRKPEDSARLRDEIVTATEEFRAASAEHARCRELLKHLERMTTLADSPKQLGRDSDRVEVKLARTNPHMEILGIGKVRGPVFDFLVTEAGCWYVDGTDDYGRPVGYLGTIAGPRLVLEEVLEVLAATFCSTTAHWVGVRSRQVQQDREDLLAIALDTLLPVPKAAHLEELVLFRERHADEFKLLRAHLQRELDRYDLATPEDLLREMAFQVAEPLNELVRALELDSKLTLSWVRQQALLKVARGTEGLVKSIGAAALASPLFGSTVDLAGTAAGVVGGAALALTAVGIGVGGAVWARSQREGQVRGPFAYVYQVGREFGFNDPPSRARW